MGRIQAFHGRHRRGGLHLYVRSYARFADDEVPVGRCTLTGILQYDATGEGRYILKLRDENDCTR